MPLRLRFHEIRIIVIVALAVASSLAGQALAQAPGELLSNPGFEPLFVQTGDSFVAAGWSAWWLTPGSPDYPDSCPEGSPATCRPYHIPTFRNTQPQDPRDPPRALSGDSQQWGAAHAVYIGGVYQRVSNITPGARLRFSAYVQSFNCSTDLGCYGPYGEYGKSYEPGENNIRVGIDPTGGVDPFSSAIVWSPAWNPIDVFVANPVEAVAQANAVTVFVWSAPQYPELHVVTYVDDASLAVIGQGPIPATATLAPTVAQPVGSLPAATPRPTIDASSAATTYTIQEGDTLFGIALQFNLTLDELLALNPGLSRDSLLQVGQTLIVGSATATPSPTATLAATATITPTASLTTTATASLCLLAFDDDDGDGAQGAGETALAGALFEVKGAQGAAVARYVTTGDEPHCLSDLPDGRYAIDMTPPEGRQATSTTSQSVGLLSGQVFTVTFGSRVVPSPTAAPTLAVETLEPTSSPASTSGDRVPLALLGFGLLALAGGVLVISLRARRR